MGKETGDDNALQRIVKIARRIEKICAQGRMGVCEKMPSHFGGFCGDSSRRRVSSGRVNPHGPIQSALQVVHSASARHSSYGSRVEQLAYCAPQAPIRTPRIRAIMMVIMRSRLVLDSKTISAERVLLLWRYGSYKEALS